MQWINMRDKTPKHIQKVFYFFEYVGVHVGQYEKIYCEDFEYFLDCFSGKKGSLCDDVTDWMPYNENDEYPDPPIEYITDKYEDYEY